MGINSFWGGDVCWSNYFFTAVCWTNYFFLTLCRRNFFFSKKNIAPLQVSNGLPLSINFTLLMVRPQNIRQCEPARCLAIGCPLHLMLWTRRYPGNLSIVWKNFQMNLFVKYQWLNWKAKSNCTHLWLGVRGNCSVWKPLGLNGTYYSYLAPC